MWISKNKFYRLNTRIIVLEREVERILSAFKKQPDFKEEGGKSMKRIREYLENQLSLQTEKKKILDEKITKLQEMLDGMGSEPDSDIAGSEEC